MTIVKWIIYMVLQISMGWPSMVDDEGDVTRGPRAMIGWTYPHARLQLGVVYDAYDEAIHKG
jgi:hypothetical protein